MLLGRSSVWRSAPFGLQGRGYTAEQEFGNAENQKIRKSEKQGGKINKKQINKIAERFPFTRSPHHGVTGGPTGDCPCPVVTSRGFILIAICWPGLP